MNGLHSLAVRSKAKGLHATRRGGTPPKNNYTLFFVVYYLGEKS